MEPTFRGRLAPARAYDRRTPRFRGAGLACSVSFCLLGSAYAGPPPIAPAMTPTEAATGRASAASVRASRGRRGALDLPVAARTDPYGPRGERIPRLSLEQIDRFALENPLIAAAGHEVDAMKAQLRKARFAWVPVIETMTTLSPGAAVTCRDYNVAVEGADGQRAAPLDFQLCLPSGKDGETRDLQKIPDYFGQLKKAGVRFEFQAEAAFPIYTFGKIKNAKALASAGVALAKLKKLEAEHETLLRVRQAHTTLLLARESLAILEEASKIASTARSRISADLGVGSVADDFDADPAEGNPNRDPDDLFRVELAELEIARHAEEARKVEALSLSALWALAGRAAPAGFDIEERRLAPVELSKGVLPLEDYKQRAFRERPEARMGRALVDAREAQEKLARSNFLPDLGLVVRGGYARSTAADKGMRSLYYVDNFNYSRFVAALGLRWQWDFHNKAFDLQRARAQLRAADSLREAALLYLGRDVEQSYFELLEARGKIDLNQRASQTSWKLVVSQEQRDTAGGGDSKELLRALERWYDWRFRYCEAVSSHNVAVARLERAVGGSLVARRGETSTLAP